MRRAALTGLLAMLAAMAATTLGAALARAAGVNFLLPVAAELSQGMKRYPMLGSVRRCRGRVGSGSSFLRSWAMYWRR